VTLETLRHLRVRIAGQERAITIHPPSYDSVVRGLIEPEGRVSRERGLVMAELVQILDVDGEPVLPDTADPILDDASALETIRRARERLYAFAVEQGRVFAICPACKSRKELDLEFYATTLGLPPPRVIDGPFIAAPGLALPRIAPPPILRPYEERDVAMRTIAPRPTTPPRAERIEIAVPSARLGISQPGDAVTATVGDIDQRREVDGWRRWASPRMDQPTRRIHYEAGHPGFRAMLRLAVALVELRTADGQHVEPTPESVANLYLADVQFLDLIYAATHDLPVGQEPRCTIHCGCGQAYLPVR
jgi:hypothetical protein